MEIRLRLAKIKGPRGRKSSGRLKGFAREGFRFSNRTEGRERRQDSGCEEFPSLVLKHDSQY